jgi:FtsP/CotA-like multicopper oxidase with cupredoxin domain
MDMLSRRNWLKSAAAALSGSAALAGLGRAAAVDPSAGGDAGRAGSRGYTPVHTLNGTTLPYKMDNGVKVFHLIAEEFEHEFAPGMRGPCWGYNGSTPGPTIEAVEGDRVRLLVTNKLPEHTTIHWHGLILPSGMDGVGGLNQPQIGPGETFAYEFTLKQHGTYMYHPHADEMVQMAAGMMGMFIIHPKNPAMPPPDRDYTFMLHSWAVHPGTRRPDPSVMVDFNIFTFNGKVFPAIEPLVARQGERVRIRIGNLSMGEHPIHLHGYTFRCTGTEGGPIPTGAQWPMATVQVPVGTTRDIEFVAEHNGDWAFHCHKSHHTMGPMGHDVPNMMGVAQRNVESRIRKLLPNYMAMGESGMAEHAEHTDMGHMPGPENTLPMMTGRGPHGLIEMGGMFTVFKVRRDQKPGDYSDPGWYDAPPEEIARRVQLG